ncbi:MAG: hypothetical protein ACRDGQ_01815 [Candidatus Limnocylindrales bacterium]
MPLGIGEPADGLFEARSVEDRIPAEQGLAGSHRQDIEFIHFMRRSPCVAQPQVGVESPGQTEELKVCRAAGERRIEHPLTEGQEFAGAGGSRDREVSSMERPGGRERIPSLGRERRRSLDFLCRLVEAFAMMQSDGQLSVQPGPQRRVILTDPAEGVATHPLNCRRGRRVGDADFEQRSLGNEIHSIGIARELRSPQGNLRTLSELAQGEQTVRVGDGDLDVVKHHTIIANSNDSG